MVSVLTQGLKNCVENLKQFLGRGSNPWREHGCAHLSGSDRSSGSPAEVATLTRASLLSTAMFSQSQPADNLKFQEKWRKEGKGKYEEAFQKKLSLQAS